MGIDPDTPAVVEHSTLGLTRLVYAFIAADIAWRGFYALDLWLVKRRTVGLPQVWGNAGAGYAAVSAFVALEMAIIVGVHRPLPRVLKPWSEGRTGGRLFADVTLGLASGLLVAVASFPLRQEVACQALLNVVVPGHHLAGLRIALATVFFVAVFPAVMEAAFRGVALRALRGHMTPGAAVLVSAVLFGHFWFVYGHVMGLLLGIVTGALYVGRRSLVAPIFAHATLIAAVGSYLVWR